MRENGSLGAWLYGVAYRTALKARKSASRRRAREERVARPETREGLAVAVVERDEIGAMLHAEVVRLPAKYRAPLVLCYFEGRTHDEAAAVLNWPVGTVRCRLSRGRHLLRSRLTRRGLAPAAAAFGAATTGSPARAEVRASLLRATLEAAVQSAPAPSAATALAEAAFESLLAARLRLAAAALGLVVMAAGLVLVSGGAPASPPKPQARNRATRIGCARPGDPLRAPVDQFGDPLPKYARARMGTIRFNEGEGVAQVAFASDGKSLFTAGSRRGVRVWDMASGRVVRTIGEDDEGQCEIAMSADARMLAVHPYAADSLRLHDAATGRELRRWHLPKEGGSSLLRFSPDGKILATVFTAKDRSAQNGELTRSIDLWDLTAPTERRRRLSEVPYSLRDLRISPDNTSLALAVLDRHIPAESERAQTSTQVWDIATGKERMRFPVRKPGFGPLSLAFSPDGRHLFAGVTDQTIRVYDLAEGREETPPLNHDHALDAIPRWDAPRKRGAGVLDRTMDCLTFSPDGSILAAAAQLDRLRRADARVCP